MGDMRIYSRSDTAYTRKRTSASVPDNRSFFDTKSITGSGDTIATLVFSSAAETLSRALIGFIIGMVLGYILALLMHLSHIVEKIAFPYLMIIQMIPILGMAPIVLSITGDISSARIIIAAILTFYPFRQIHWQASSRSAVKGTS